MKKACIALALLLQSNISAWVSKTWYGQNVYWGSNPKFWTNTSTPISPENYRVKVPFALNAWKYSGSSVYPYHGGLTGRDCGDGDYWGDDDDGYNVIDWWTTCNLNDEGDICEGNSNGHQINIDYVTTTAQRAESDIVICSNRIWDSTFISSSSKNNYQAVLTHELGHSMGLEHSDQPTSTVVATMHPTGNLTYKQNWSRLVLSWDEMNFIDARYGSCLTGEWNITSAQQNTTRTEKIWNRCGVSLDVSITTPTSYENWLPPISVKNSRLGAFIKQNTYLQWEEYDRNHAAVVTATIVGVDGVAREIHYARNAPNWADNPANIGWRTPLNRNNVPAFIDTYNTWVACQADLYNDYLLEYNVHPFYMEGLSLRHFVNTQWATGTSHGAEIRTVKIQRY